LFFFSYYLEHQAIVQGKQIPPLSKWRRFFRLGLPQQTVDGDCGVFALALALELLAEAAAHPGQEHVNYFRRFFTQQLVFLFLFHLKYTVSNFVSLTSAHMAKEHQVGRPAGFRAGCPGTGTGSQKCLRIGKIIIRNLGR
jgi:hypothetical protein